MGEAKRRGTFEERKQMAIAKMEARRQRWLEAEAKRQAAKTAAKKQLIVEPTEQAPNTPISLNRKMSSKHLMLITAAMAVAAASRNR